MLVFILPGSHPQLLENTLSSLGQVLMDASPVVIHNEDQSAEVMNEVLSRTDAAWFMTLYAGDILLPHASSEFEPWLHSFTHRTAGYIVNIHHTAPTITSSVRSSSTFQFPRGPLLWRTEAVLDGLYKGFATKEQLPFQKYVLIDKQLQLATRYEWSRVDSDAMLAHPYTSPGWTRVQEEWEALFPLLHASAHQHAGIAVRLPLVTIVMCTYNDGEYLPWAVRSVLAQTVTAWELVIIDDGSTDETAAFLQGLPHDSRIQWVQQQENLGKTRSLNRALEMARAPWLLELDADDWLSPHCLEVLLHEAGSVQNAAVIYGHHVEWLERTNKQLIYRGIRTAPYPLTAKGLLQDPLAIAPRMFNVSKLRQLKGWDVDMPYDGRLYEDIGILTNITCHHEVQHVPQAQYHRRLRSSSVTHRHPNHYTRWKNALTGIRNRK